MRADAHADTMVGLLAYAVMPFRACAEEAVIKMGCWKYRTCITAECRGIVERLVWRRTVGGSGTERNVNVRWFWPDIDN